MPSPYKIRHHPAKKRSHTGRAVILLAILSLLLGGFIYTVLLDNSKNVTQIEEDSLYPKIYAEDLGKSSENLKEKYPNLFLSKNRDGLLIGQHKLKDAQYIIWFVAENKDYIAFRIKASQTYDKLEEKAMLAYFARYFGRPFDAACQGKTTSATQSCHYKWWVRDGVSLDVYSRTRTDGRVILDAITTDTYLMAKHHNIIRSVIPTR